MKILIIRNYPSYMDVANNTYNIQEVGLAKALVRLSHKADVVFWTDREEKVLELPVEGCGAVHVYYKHGRTLLKNTVYPCDELFRRYDILQVAEYSQIQSWMLAKKYPRKTIVYHGPYDCAFNKRYNLMCAVFDAFFLKDYIRTGTHFLAKSELAKEFLQKKGIAEKNIRMAGVGIDTQMLCGNSNPCEAPVFRKMKQDENRKFLYIGRFEKRRNVTFLLEVFARLKRKYPHITLYLIGTGEKNYMDAVWKRAEQLQIREDIVYQPKIEQNCLADIYKMADFFLLPTRYEIFGMVLLEAMYYGNAVFTSVNGGSGTLIRDGENGVLCREFLPDRWSGKIAELLENREALQKMKENAHRTVAMSYTWDRLAPVFVAEYRKVTCGQ